jgi:hypothetical protein
MNLVVKYDPDASSISEKLTFYCDKFELAREDIMRFKDFKYVAFVKGDDLPDRIVCEVLVRLEGFRKAKIMFFNLAFPLPEAVYEEPLLNRNLIEWSKRNGGFWLEFDFFLNGPDREMALSFEL